MPESDPSVPFYVLERKLVSYEMTFCVLVEMISLVNRKLLHAQPDDKSDHRGEIVRPTEPNRSVSALTLIKDCFTL